MAPHQIAPLIKTDKEAVSEPRRSRRLAQRSCEDKLPVQSTKTNTGSTIPRKCPIQIYRPPSSMCSSVDLASVYSSATRSSSSYSLDTYRPYDPENLENADMEGGVRNANYRINCLSDNNILFRHPAAPLPSVMTVLVTGIVHDEPEPTAALSPDEVALAIHDLDELGLLCSEQQVALWLYIYVLPQLQEGFAIGTTSGKPMKHPLPHRPLARFPIVPPRPDLLYGYQRISTSSTASRQVFTEAQRITLNELSSEASDLEFPFLTIEVKAAASTQGSLWVAANQCAGASAVCLETTDQLNRVAKGHGWAGDIINICYSIAVDNNMAQLYVSWKEEDDQFYVQRVGALVLSNPEHVVRFRHWFLGIVAWGQSRLNDICHALDYIREARQELASKVAKSRSHEENNPPESKRLRTGA